MRKWELLKRQDIPDLLDKSKTYLTRWNIVRTPWGGLFLHAIRLPDRDRDLHGHPFPFVTLILSNGYEEARVESLEAGAHWRSTGDAPVYSWRPGSIHSVSRRAYHAITNLHDESRPVWTLVIAGKFGDGWGYTTPDGYIDHDAYHVGRNDQWASPADVVTP